MTLHQIITDAIAKRPKARPETIADRILDEVDRASLVTVLADEIARVQRNGVRSVERQAFDAVFSSRRTVSEAIEAETERREAFAALYRERFALGDGTIVAWGKATIEQHAQRIAMLEAMRAGIADTIERHRKAIHEITAAGVTCLEEVAELSLAA